MPDFIVKHNYRAARDGQQFGPWVAGDQVQLTEVDAEWVNRDSPGALTELDAEPVAEETSAPEPKKPPAANRQAKPGANRGKS